MGHVADACDGCGFVWDDVAADEVPRRIRAGVVRIDRAVTSEEPEALRRPSPDRWSAVEYAAHVRDVLLVQRDRLVTALVEDTPAFTPMYRDRRVDLGLYRRDDLRSMPEELDVAAELFVRFFDSIDADQLGRPVIYNFPEPRERTVLWMAQQAVHEVEHHAADIEQNMSLVRETGGGSSTFV